MAAKVEKSFNIDKMPGRGTVVINGAPILLIWTVNGELNDKYLVETICV